MYPAIVPRLSNGGKELGAFPLLLIIVSYPRAETSQRAKPRQKRRGGSRPELCDVYHRDRTVENRYLDRGKKARQQLGLHVTARAICHPALPICGSYLLSRCRGQGYFGPMPARSYRRAPSVLSSSYPSWNKFNGQWLSRRQSKRCAASPLRRDGIRLPALSRIEKNSPTFQLYRTKISSTRNLNVYNFLFLTIRSLSSILLKNSRIERVTKTNSFPSNLRWINKNRTTI